MTTPPEHSQSSASKSPTPSPKSGTTSAGPNPFQGPGAEEAWKRLLAQPSRVVSREEMIRRAQEQAAAKKQ